MGQFSETKTKHKVEMQDLQKKLEIETSLKFQSDDANKKKKVELQILSEKLGVAHNVELKITKMAKKAETDVASLKSQLHESHKVNEKKTLELNTIQEKLIEVEANAACSKYQFNHVKKKDEAETQVLQKKLEIAIKA